MTAAPTPRLLGTTDPSTYSRDVPPAEIVTAGTPSAETWAVAPFEGLRAARCGIWLGQPGSMRTAGYPHDEVFVVLEGRVALESEDGSRIEVPAGQACFVPEGWRGLWHTIDSTRKVYFIAARPDTRTAS